MVVDMDDLSDLEAAVLGVLSLGLPPSRAAGDDSFRIDHCVAVVMGLLESSDGEANLMRGSPDVSPSFRERLRGAVGGLVDTGVLAFQPPHLPAAPGGFEPSLAVDMVNPDTHPTLLDRWLGQQCLDALLSRAEVYQFLMAQYARAGEFWRSAREQGYAR